MFLYYLDTSALLKLYYAEPGAVDMARLAAQARAGLAISALGVLEFRAVVRAHRRGGSLAAAAAEAMLAHFDDLASRTLLRQPLTDAVFTMAASLVDRHPLRAPDALQLAACVALHQNQPAVKVLFVCSDHALLAAAAAERIPAWDPVTGGPPPGTLL